MTDRISRIRKSLNLSQDEFGAMLSVSRQAVSKWELGQSTPDIEVLRKIKELFGISYDELLGNDDMLEKSDFTELNIEMITILRRKKQFFYYSIVFIVIALTFFLYYITIRLNGFYDAFIFNSYLKTIQYQQGLDWFYYFVRYGLIALSASSALIGSLFLYYSHLKSNIKLKWIVLLILWKVEINNTCQTSLENETLYYQFI